MKVKHFLVGFNESINNIHGSNKLPISVKGKTPSSSFVIIDAYSLHNVIKNGPSI